MAFLREDSERARELRHPDRANLIDGSIGEGSPFHHTFGYYAQGVGPTTATLPTRWEDRLIRVHNVTPPRRASSAGAAFVVAARS